MLVNPFTVASDRWSIGRYPLLSPTSSRLTHGVSAESLFDADSSYDPRDLAERLITEAVEQLLERRESFELLKRYTRGTGLAIDRVTQSDLLRYHGFLPETGPLDLVADFKHATYAGAIVRLWESGGSDRVMETARRKLTDKKLHDRSQQARISVADHFEVLSVHPDDLRPTGVDFSRYGREEVYASVAQFIELVPYPTAVAGTFLHTVQHFGPDSITIDTQLEQTFSNEAVAQIALPFATHAADHKQLRAARFLLVASTAALAVEAGVVSAYQDPSVLDTQLPPSPHKILKEAELSLFSLAHAEQLAFEEAHELMTAVALRTMRTRLDSTQQLRLDAVALTEAWWRADPATSSGLAEQWSNAKRQHWNLCKRQQRDITSQTLAELESREDTRALLPEEESIREAVVTSVLSQLCLQREMQLGSQDHAYRDAVGAMDAIDTAAAIHRVRAHEAGSRGGLDA